MRKALKKRIRKFQRKQHISEVTRAQFDRAGLPRLNIRIDYSAEPKAHTDVILARKPNGFDALISQHLDGGTSHMVENKIASYCYWFSQAPEAVKSILVNASDGDQLTFAQYKFSSASPRHTLLPDAHFFRDFGYAATDDFAKQHAMKWDDRSDDFTWRGGLNGRGLLAFGDDEINKPGVVQRLHMAKKCNALGLDFRFVVQNLNAQNIFLHNTDLLGDFIPTHDWGSKKYAIDIDGYTNAWCNFMQRLKLGCCVLKVDSAFGFRQWYYDRIKPWEHFVPIRADLTDLETQVEWVRSNQGKAREIAQNGQSFARQMTFETETNFAREAIEQREALS